MLCGLLALLGRDQLRGDLLLEDGGQHLAHLVVLRPELLAVDDPADQVLDQGLRHPGVHRVVRHLVTHAVGAPAQGQLGEVARAEHDSPALVGDPEEVVGAQPGLDVLEGHVVDLLAGGERVAEVGEQLLRGGPDVDLLEGDAERLAQPGRVALGGLAGREARQREREDVAARSVHPVHRLGRDDQRVRRVEAAGDADDDLRLPDRAEALLEAGDLDVVGLVAVQRQAGRVVGDEREPVDLAAQPDVARGRVERELDLVEVAGLHSCLVAVVVEGALPQALLADPVEVDVHDGAPRSVGEALALAEQVAALVDHRLAVPGQVGARLPLAAGGVEVGRQVAEARGADQQPTVLGAADGDR